MKHLFGGNIVKDIEDAEKANKLAAKMTKTPSSTGSYRGNRVSPYYSAVNRRFQGRSGYASKMKYASYKSAPSSRGKFRSDRGGSSELKSKK